MNAEVEKILEEFGHDQRNLIHILHHIQARYAYIPPPTISFIAKHLKISESEIYGVLTFYKAFTLSPRGKHLITVCTGTACHVRGGPHIVEELERNLAIKVGQTTANKEFSLETVNCLGCCAIGPVVVVNEKYYSHVTVNKVGSILNEYRTAK